MKKHHATHSISGDPLPECSNKDECTVEYKNLMIGTWWEQPSGTGCFGTSCILYKQCPKKRKHYNLE